MAYVIVNSISIHSNSECPYLIVTAAFAILSRHMSFATVYDNTLILILKKYRPFLQVKVGKMIVCPSMNITIRRLGGVSILGMFTTT